MSQVTQKNFSSSDYPDAPPWFRDKFLPLLTEIIGSHSQALAGKITLGDNIEKTDKTVTIKKADLPFGFDHPIKPSIVQVTGLSVGEGQPKPVDGVGAIQYRYENGQIVIYNIGGVADEPREFALLII